MNQNQKPIWYRVSKKARPFMAVLCISESHSLAVKLILLVVLLGFLIQDEL